MDTEILNRLLEVGVDAKSAVKCTLNDSKGNALFHGWDITEMKISGIEPLYL